jgi:DNA-binding PucR family transcriptional regulator
MKTDEALRLILSSSTEVARGHALCALSPLDEYDREHGGDLRRTLATYLACGCNASKTAGELYLHRSGLLYRLRRIESLLGLNLDNFEVRTALSIAIISANHPK